MKAANMHNCGIKKPQKCIKGFTNYTMKWKFKQVKTFSLKYMNKDQIAEEFSCCLLAMIRWGEWWVQILLSYYQLYGTKWFFKNTPVYFCTCIQCVFKGTVRLAESLGFSIRYYWPTQ